MPAKINLLNQQIGKLKVIKETDKRKNKSVVWECECECGNLVEFSTKELRSDGLIQCHNCGNNREPQTQLLEDIIGKKFNHLTVKEKTEARQGGKIVYRCECDCGSGKDVYTNRTDLQSDHTISCGCAKLKYSIGEVINNRKILNYTFQKRKSYIVKCLFCNYEYTLSAEQLDRTFSCGCQKSIGEFNITTVLESNNIKYKKEYQFPNSNYRFDFLIFMNDKPFRLIEFDGEQHYSENIKNSGWNTIEHYNKTVERDNNKNLLSQQYSLPLVRIPYWERNNITLEMLLGDQYLIS